MSNTRRIRRRHDDHELLAAEVLTQLRVEGCVCQPEMEIPRHNGNRITVHHAEGCPIDPDRDDFCASCLREDRERTQ